MESLQVFVDRTRPIAEAKDRAIIEERKKRSTSLDYILAPTITDFFRGGCVLITGGTGFVGKVLTEKLLRSCPGIDRIYFLVREKRGKTPEERVKEMFKSELFEKVTRENPEALKKVVPIVGDVAEVGLGISEDDRMLLQHTTTVVFHAAATVRFDETFTKAVLLNCRGTREVVELCKTMFRLKSMVHVSTTYCNLDRAVNEEIVYPAHLHWRDVIKIAERNEPGDLQALHAMLIGDLPNIYTFTKRIAENIVNDSRHEIPVIIGRPCVVVATESDPLEGWWGNFIGPPGLYVGLSSGVLRVFYANPEVCLDYFAVDYCIRELILLAWIRGCKFRINTDSDEIDVVNMSVSDCYEPTQAETLMWDQDLNKKLPPLGIRSPSLALTQNKFYYMYRLMMSHVLFGAIVDILLRLVGKKPRLLKIYRRAQAANNAVEYFICNKYKSISDKYTKSITFLKEEDVDQFGQIIAFNFWNYTVNAKTGVDRYLIKKLPDYDWNRKVQTLLTVIGWTWAAIKAYAVYCLLHWYFF